MSGALKRVLWCRWFHRYRMPRRPSVPVTSSVPGGTGVLRMTAGPRRACCGACRDTDYASRAARRWLMTP